MTLMKRAELEFIAQLSLQPIHLQCLSTWAESIWSKLQQQRLPSLTAASLCWVLPSPQELQSRAQLSELRAPGSPSSVCVVCCLCHRDAQDSHSPSPSTQSSISLCWPCCASQDNLKLQFLESRADTHCPNLSVWLPAQPPASQRKTEYFMEINQQLQFLLTNMAWKPKH